jgi:hypothetical protein
MDSGIASSLDIGASSSGIVLDVGVGGSSSGMVGGNSSRLGAMFEGWFW